MGIGILAKMAFDPARDHGIRLINADHLFAASTTRLGLRRNAYLRGYVYDFIELFSPTLSRAVVTTALSATGSGFEAASP
jgi:LysR family cys regulon transcriptional activator